MAVHRRWTSFYQEFDWHRWSGISSTTFWISGLVCYHTNWLSARRFSARVSLFEHIKIQWVLMLWPAKILISRSCRIKAEVLILIVRMEKQKQLPLFPCWVNIPLVPESLPNEIRFHLFKSLLLSVFPCTLVPFSEEISDAFRLVWEVLWELAKLVDKTFYIRWWSEFFKLINFFCSSFDSIKSK